VPPRHPTIAAAVGVARRSWAQRRGDGLGVLVACSGGADSVGLLGVLALLRRAQGWTLEVAHVHHGLRATAERDAELVGAHAQALGLPVHVERLALAGGADLAARARAARHGALQRVARARRLSTIALAHTATDQAETVLLRLARGVGLAGLAAMSEWAPGVFAAPPVDEAAWLWRPWLALTREQARALATRLGLAFLDDPSNAVLDAPRVQVRERVLPALEGLHPGATRAIAAAAGEARTLAGHVAAQVAAALPPAQDGAVAAAAVAGLPPALRPAAVRELLRQGGAELGELTRRTVDAVVAGLDAWAQGDRAPRRWQLAGGLDVRLEHGMLAVVPAAGALDAADAGPEPGAGGRAL